MIWEITVSILVEFFHLIVCRRIPSKLLNYVLLPTKRFENRQIKEVLGTYSASYFNEFQKKVSTHVLFQNSVSILWFSRIGQRQSYFKLRKLSYFFLKIIFLKLYFTSKKYKTILFIVVKKQRTETEWIQIKKCEYYHSVIVVVSEISYTQLTH